MNSGHLKLDGESIESTLALSFTIWISTTSIINFGHAFFMSILFYIVSILPDISHSLQQRHPICTPTKTHFFYYSIKYIYKISLEYIYT